MSFLQPLSRLPELALGQLLGVLTDIDDTLTTDGAITPDALKALTDLKAAGLRVVAITGRPVGWSVPFAQTWPVDAIVAENGAVALIPFEKNIHLEGDYARDMLERIYIQTAPTRASNFDRMQRVAARVLSEVAGARLAQDSPGRETDIAIDHSEFTHLPPDGIIQVVKIMQSEGMNATVSSIHVNGWFGRHNKLMGARWIVRQLFGCDLDAEIHRWLYVGDSTNDQLMFQHFPLSVGVANVRRFEAELKHKPRYITPSERGSGFSEVAARVLAHHVPDFGNGCA